jgi:membrane protein DedA with SNARE-associated domain
MDSTYKGVNLDINVRYGILYLLVRPFVLFSFTSAVTSGLILLLPAGYLIVAIKYQLLYLEKIIILILKYTCITIGVLYVFKRSLSVFSQDQT